MANNDQNNNKNGKGRNNLRGILTLVAWALVLTVGFNYLNAYNRNATNKSTSHEIKYSEMLDLIENDKAKEVLFKDDAIYITPVEGYTYTEEQDEDSNVPAKSYTQSKDTKLTLYTAYLNDTSLLPLLKEHKVAYTGYYEAQMNPVLAFMVGIFAAECIHRHYKYMEKVHWRQMIILAEIALLFAVGFLPQSQNLLANAIVSFSCAMQVQAFRKVDGYAFASTMCIGNMRSGMQYLYTGLHTKDRAVLRRAMQYFAVIALFAVGAAAGSLLTIHFGNRVIWFCCASLLVSLSFMFIREDIEENPELQREAAALHQDVKAMEHTIGKTLQEQQEELHPLNHK